MSDENRPCYRCGKNPAEGFASVWTAATGERWYCHGDDDETPTCYEGADLVDPDAFGEAGYLLRPPLPEPSVEHARWLLAQPRPAPFVLDPNIEPIWGDDDEESA